MSLLECLVGITLCALLLNPLLKASAQLATKQIEYEKTQSLISEAERAFELMGRAIRMAGYQNIKTKNHSNKSDAAKWFIQVNKKVGYRGSDSMSVQYELSDGIDFDCIGNILSKERTKKDLVFQGFIVERQAGIAKGAKANGGSLICQSLDRQGRVQNTTLMNGINHLFVEDISHPQREGGIGDRAPRLYKISLQMTDGALINMDFERTFATRNMP
jgi:type II secretory pathway component PulJ